MPWIDVDQRDVEWLKMRTGVCTASRMHDVVAKLKVNCASGKKGDPKATRQAYREELLAERLTGRAAEKFVTEWMQRGVEDEILARAAYEYALDVEVENGGFYLHDSIEYFGASPDGRIGDIGLLELKNFKPEKHRAILKSGCIPEECMWQINAQLACAPEREWVDWGSYCKEYLNPEWRLFVRRHYRDRQRIAEIEHEVETFNAEIAFDLMEMLKIRPILTELVPQTVNS